MEQFNILYVDDEEINLNVFEATFDDRFNIFTATSGDEGLEILKEQTVEVIIVDQRMPGMSGVEFLKQVIPDHPEPIRLILTGYSDIDVIIEAVNDCGIFRYLTKPWQESEMIQVLEQGLEVYSLRRDNKKLINELQQANEGLEAKVEERTKEVVRQKETLTIQNRQLQKLNEEKNNLIGVVAHDLRSPVNQIKGLIDLLRMESSGTPPSDTTYIDKIIDATERMTYMIDRILDADALDRMPLNLRLEDLNIAALLQKVVEDTSVVAAKKNITLHVADNLQPCNVVADKNYLMQVFENLLSNAIKFSNSGSNVYTDFYQGDNEVRVGIRDEGPGILEEDKPRLFGKFQKLSARPTAGEASTGLGLSIVKRFIDNMEGRIWCESEPGRGATFYVSLPLQRI